MKAKLIFLASIPFIIIFLLTACSEKKSADAPADTSDIPTNPTAPERITHTDLPDVNTDYTSLEVTPSGDSRCFLSPCDCNCYVTPNIPLVKRKPTCATNCKADYGITGCRFTNFQCYTLK